MFYRDSVHRENCLAGGFLLVESWGATSCFVWFWNLHTSGSQNWCARHRAFESLTLTFILQSHTIKGP